MIRLRQIHGADAGRELELDQDLIRIGRMPDSDVNFDPETDLDASGRHAEIRNEDGRYLLIDAGSRNGTWLNGQRIKHVAVRQGDEIEFGRGGPKVIVTSLRPRHPSPGAAVPRPSSGAPRNSRFDPLAMPVTTATRLEDLVGKSHASAVLEPQSTPDDLEPSDPTARSRRTSLFWAVTAIIALGALGWIALSSLS